MAKMWRLAYSATAHRIGQTSGESRICSFKSARVLDCKECRGYIDVGDIFLHHLGFDYCKPCAKRLFGFKVFSVCDNHDHGPWDTIKGFPMAQRCRECRLISINPQWEKEQAWERKRRKRDFETSYLLAVGAID